MGDKDYSSYFIDFAKQLGALNGNISSVLQRLEKGDAKLADHEARLTTIEMKSREERGECRRDEPLKEWIIKALIRIIGWGTVVIASLSGAGDLVRKISVG